MSHRPTTLLLVLIVALVSLPAAVARQGDPAEVQLKAAISKEVVEGDLKAAIELYRKIADGSNRVVAARALVRMGRCYEKLGDAEARKAYERVVREFGDQKEAVDEARALLAAGARTGQLDTGLTVQQKRVFPAGRRTTMHHVSADGRYVPFDYSGSVWLLDLTTGEERRVIAGTPGRQFAISPELSPDGRQIAYGWTALTDGPARQELRVAGIDGSGARVLMQHPVQAPIPKAWSPDGRHILVLLRSASGEFSHGLVSPVDGSARMLTTRDNITNGCFSPDGKFIVAYRASVQGGQFMRIPAGLTVVPSDGSAPYPLFESTANNWAPFWTPDGRRIVFLSDRSGTTDLWSVRVTGGKTEGDPELVKREAASIESDPIGFTRDGLFYYKTSSSVSDIHAVDVDPSTGRVTSQPVPVNLRSVGSANYPLAWSPDGQWLAYTRIQRRELGYAVSKAVSIIVRADTTGEEREIAHLPGFSQGYPKALLWLPDGRTLLADDAAGGFLFHRIDVQTGLATAFDALGEDKQGVWYPALSPDGKVLFYVQYGSRTKGVPRVVRLMRRDLTSGETRELYRATGVELDNPAVSPDGRRVAFEVSDWNGKPSTFRLLIVPSEGGTPRELLRSGQYIDDNVWMRDGRHILMTRKAQSGPPELWSMPVEGGEPQRSGLVIQGSGYGIALHPDGRRLAYPVSVGPAEELWVIRNLLAGSRPAAR